MSLDVYDSQQLESILRLSLNKMAFQGGLNARTKAVLLYAANVRFILLNDVFMHRQNNLNRKLFTFSFF